MRDLPNADRAEAPVPLLIVMWHGNRVVVHGEDAMRTTSRRPAMGTIAGCIGDAESVPAMLAALRTSTIGATHDVDASIEDHVLVIRLTERPAADGP
jgi:hypothetical protein